MANKYIPLFLRHSTSPRLEAFALLAGLEAAVRGTLISAMPLTVYASLGSAEATSSAYFWAGVVALIWGLMVPWFTRHVPRRWMYTSGCLLYLVGMGLAISEVAVLVPYALMCLSAATAPCAFTQPGTSCPITGGETSSAGRSIRYFPSHCGSSQA